jgi:hypothetical protein
MDDLIDMIVADQSPSDISDRIKEILMQKSAENIDIIRPVVAASVFGNEENVEESDDEVAEEDAE